MYCITRAGNFRTVDIEMTAWSSLFLNLVTNLILYLYPEKCIKFNQSKWSIRSREFSLLIKINIQRREGLSNFEKKNGFWFFCTKSKKSGLSKKVSTLDIRIKQSGLKVFLKFWPARPYTFLGVMWGRTKKFVAGRSPFFDEYWVQTNQHLRALTHRWSECSKLEELSDPFFKPDK